MVGGRAATWKVAFKCDAGRQRQLLRLWARDRYLELKQAVHPALSGGYSSAPLFGQLPWTTTIATSAIAFTALALWAVTARAEMGPCLSADHGSLICGSGDGAARTIPETALTFQTAGSCLAIYKPAPDRSTQRDDPNLENVIVHIDDGAILAKSRGAYWHLGDRYAPRQYLRAAWSPDSRMLIKTAGSVDVSDYGRTLRLREDDRITGPFDLAKVLYPAIRAR